MFTGRINRQGFLLGQLYMFVPLVGTILAYAILNFVFSTSIGDSPNTFRSLVNIILFIVGAASIILFIPVSIGLSVRRWHDMGQTGLLFLLGLLPFVGWIVFFVQLFAVGTKGKNQYGAPVSVKSFVPVLFGSK